MTTKPQPTLNDDYYRPSGRPKYSPDHQVELNPDGPGFVCRCAITDWPQQRKVVWREIQKHRGGA